MCLKAGWFVDKGQASNEQTSKGQAMMESLLVLPILLLVLAGIAQALWLFAGHQLLQSAAMHGVRAASLAGGQSGALLLELNYRMKALPGHAVHVPKLTRQLPTKEELELHGESVSETEHELAVDFPMLRWNATPASEREAFLQVRVLQYEIVWCQPLLIPVVNELLESLNQRSIDPAQQYCNAQQALVRQPLQAHRVTAAAPLYRSLRFRP